MLIQVKKLNESLEIGNLRLKIVAIEPDERIGKRVRLQIVASEGELTGDVAVLANTKHFRQFPDNELLHE